LAFYVARKQNVQPTPLHFAGFTCLVFAAQMTDFNALIGVSGSIIGGTFLVATLGPGFALWSITVVLAVQTFLFGDAGVLTFGANIIGGVLSVTVSALILRQVTRFSKLVNLALASWFSGLAVAVYVSLILSTNKIGVTGWIIRDMVELHAWVAIGRSLATMAFIVIFCGDSSWPIGQRAFRATSGTLLFSALVLVVFFAPYASQLPSMVEAVMQKYALGSGRTEVFTPWLDNYAFPGQSPTPLSIGLCGVVGTLLTYWLARWLGKRLAS
jgi:ABC-type Co2+ transport system permease subunit